MKHGLTFLCFFFASVVVTTGVLAAEDCPPTIDPVYCQVAKETGGKVYVGDPDDVMDQVKKDLEHPKPQEKAEHTYSPYSKDMGCTGISDQRGSEICQSISKHLVWGWTGHAVISPGWKFDFESLKEVYCETKIRKDDFDILMNMCTNIKGRGACTKPEDPRLSLALEGLINLVVGLDGGDAFTKGTVYDPKSDSYLLKDGCPKIQ